MITEDITRKELTIVLTPWLLTGSGCTTCSCCSWRPFSTSLKSMASFASSIISRGGRLKPLQVSLLHRQTITCNLLGAVKFTQYHASRLTLMILTSCWLQTAWLYLWYETPLDVTAGALEHPRLIAEQKLDITWTMNAIIVVICLNLLLCSPKVVRETMQDTWLSSGHALMCRNGSSFFSGQSSQT